MERSAKGQRRCRAAECKDGVLGWDSCVTSQRSLHVFGITRYSALPPPTPQWKRQMSNHQPPKSPVSIAICIHLRTAFSLNIKTACPINDELVTCTRVTQRSFRMRSANIRDSLSKTPLLILPPRAFSLRNGSHFVMYDGTRMHDENV